MDAVSFALLWFTTLLIAAPAYAQYGSVVSDYPEVGPANNAAQTPTPLTSSPVPPSSTAPAPRIDIQPDSFADLSHMSIPSVQLRSFTPIDTPKLGAFRSISELNLPPFAEIKTVEPKFAEEPATPTVNMRSLPPLKIPTPTYTPPSYGPYFEGGGEGGSRLQNANSNIPSTPTPSPLQPYIWGQSSTPISNPQTPNQQTPYTWGQSSTPISSPTPLNTQAPNRQTPYVWGQSSSPIGAPQPLIQQIPNRQNPYVWGQSSTPVSSQLTPPNWGPSSTPRGQFSSSRGESSTPHGTSSTPHGESSTPHSPSSR